jgi:hypothetical protein
VPMRQNFDVDYRRMISFRTIFSDSRTFGKQ